MVNNSLQPILVYTIFFKGLSCFGKIFVRKDQYKKESLVADAGTRQNCIVKIFINLKHYTICNCSRHVKIKRQNIQYYLSV